MEFRVLLVLTIALIMMKFALGVSHAALPAVMYWKSVFPNTPMPKALRNLLPPTAEGNYNDNKYYKDNIAAGSGLKAGNVRTTYAYGTVAGNMNMLTDMVKNKNQVVDAFNGYNFKYSNPSEEFADGNVPTDYKDAFFFESELHPGRKMNIADLIKKLSTTAFLSRPVADSIPFSTQKFEDILKYFSLETKSAEANLLKQTIENCERPAIEGEEKYCATSFESFIDLGVSKLGKDIRLLPTELEKETKNKEFTIGQGMKMIGESVIVCHKMDYAYAVFLCHSIDKTAVYTVPLVGADGTRARALAVCHKDTSAWNLKHLAFQVLKVKPGTVPICHFLAKETLVWVPN